jgi:RecA-family ATPase
MAKEYTGIDIDNLQEPSPDDWIIDGLLRTNRGRPSLLSGFAEAGKSTLGNYMAITVANGTPFLRRATQLCHVLLWKNEDSAEDVGSDLKAGGYIPGVSKLTFLIPDQNDKTRQHNFDAITGALGRHPDTRLVIIEMLPDFLLLEDITDNDESRKGLQEFCTKLVDAYPNCAFLCLVHESKSRDDSNLSSKRIMGATAFPGGTDAKLYLRTVSDDDPRRVFHATVRARKGKPIKPTYLEFNPNTLTYDLGMTVEEDNRLNRKVEKTKQQKDYEAKLMQALVANQGILKGKLAETPGKRKTESLIIIDALIKEGIFVSRNAEGPGNPEHIYSPSFAAALDTAAQDESKEETNG